MRMIMECDPEGYLKDLTLRGIELLRGLDVPNIGQVADDWDDLRIIGMGRDGRLLSAGGIFYIPFIDEEGRKLDRTLPPEQVMDHVPGTHHNKSSYLIHYSARELTQDQFAVFMAHIGMDRLGSLMHDSELSADVRHLHAVLYDRQVSQALTGQPYLREDGLRQICEAFDLESPLGKYDDRPFRIEGDRVLLG